MTEIDRETWVRLGDNLERIRKARAKLAAEERAWTEEVSLEFDVDDQARVVRKRRVYPTHTLPS